MQKYEKINKSIFIFIVTIAIVGAVFTDPGSPVGSICVFNKITGYYCPFCGLTHSFNSTLHLNISDAFNYNLLGPLLFIILVLLAVKLLIELVSGVNIKVNVLQNKYLPLIIISVFLIYGLIRNIFQL
ncbi:DUF2752 domain-containing protein [candidate division KSB1 bacterium]